MKEKTSRTHVVVLAVVSGTRRYLGTDGYAVANVEYAQRFTKRCAEKLAKEYAAGCQTPFAVSMPR